MGIVFTCLNLKNQLNLMSQKNSLLETSKQLIISAKIPKCSLQTAPMKLIDNSGNPVVVLNNKKLSSSSYSDILVLDVINKKSKIESQMVCKSFKVGHQGYMLFKYGKKLISALKRNPYFVEIKGIDSKNRRFYMDRLGPNAAQIFDVLNQQQDSKKTTRFALALLYAVLQSIIFQANENKIVNTNLNIEKFLISKDGQLKCIDFGSAEKTTKDHQTCSAILLKKNINNVFFTLMKFDACNADLGFLKLKNMFNTAISFCHSNDIEKSNIEAIVNILKNMLQTDIFHRKASNKEMKDYFYY